MDRNKERYWKKEKRKGRKTKVEKARKEGKQILPGLNCSSDAHIQN